MIHFECNRNSYLRTNKEVEKGPICVVFLANFPVLDNTLKFC